MKCLGLIGVACNRFSTPWLRRRTSVNITPKSALWHNRQRYDAGHYESLVALSASGHFVEADLRPVFDLILGRHVGNRLEYAVQHAGQDGARGFSFGSRAPVECHLDDGC